VDARAAFRIAYHPNQTGQLVIAFESPEQFIGGAVTLPAQSRLVYLGELNNGALTTTPNLHPDILPKLHMTGTSAIAICTLRQSVVVLLSGFQNPVTSSTSTVTGGGGSLNLTSNS